MSEIRCSSAEGENLTDRRGGRKMKFSMNESEIQSIWDHVSEFIESNMLKQKGVNIPNFGLFSFNQVKLDIGQNKYVLLQRPLFILSEKLCLTHGLKQHRTQITGSVPVVTLNYTSLMLQSGFSRDQIEACVREMVTATNHSIVGQSGTGTELVFTRIGRLQIRGQQVKFKFYKNFVTSLDQSGKIIGSMQNRPGTADSVMSERPGSRPFSTVNPLPRISMSSGQGRLPVIDEQQIFDCPQQQHQEGLTPNVLKLEPNAQDCCLDPQFSADDVGLTELPGVLTNDEENVDGLEEYGERIIDCGLHDVTSGLQVDGVGELGDSVMELELNEGAITTDNVASTPQLPLPKPPSRGSVLSNCDSGPFNSRRVPAAAVARPVSAAGSCCSNQSCCSNNELCYICFQRQRRNVAISFSDQLKERAQEEERVLQSFQNMRDKEHLLKEQEKMLVRKHESQKAAAYNLGVAEAVKTHTKSKDPNMYRSYIFEHRPLTPPKVIKQNLLSNDLSKQVDDKSSHRRKVEEDESFMERLEQMQLAEDLAKQRKQFLNSKEKQRDLYKKALDAQVSSKPESLPKSESESAEPPFFGKNDVTAEKILEKRIRAQDVLRAQLEEADRKKREAIEKKLQEQNHEEKVLDRVKHDLLEDRARRFERATRLRQDLEAEWECARQHKAERDLETRLQASVGSSVLVHEQTDQYRRCGQCRRKLANRGTSNIWRETYFQPGTRYIY